MAQTMEQLGRRVTGWRSSLLDKVLKVNTGKSKVMVGISGGHMIVNSGKWPCRETLESAQYVKGGFTSSVVVYVVTCRWYMTVSGVSDGTIQEADLAEYIVVDGETYGSAKSFCYLGDTLDGDGGADLAVTARIRNGWMKFREFLPFLPSRAPPLEMKGRVYASCVRSSMTYGSEIRPLLAMVPTGPGNREKSGNVTWVPPGPGKVRLFINTC